MDALKIPKRKNAAGTATASVLGADSQESGCLRPFRSLQMAEGLPAAHLQQGNLGLTATIEAENHVYCCADLNWLTIQHVRLVPPLPYGIDRCLIEHWRAAHGFQVLDCAGFADGCFEHNRALNTGRLGNRRVLRLNLLYKITLHYA